MLSKGHILAVLMVSILVVSFGISFAAEQENEQAVKIGKHDVNFFSYTATLICYVDKKPKATIDFFGDMRFVKGGYALVEAKNIKVALFPKKPKEEGDSLDTEAFFKISDSDWESGEEKEEKFEKLMEGVEGAFGDFVQKCLDRIEIP